MTKWIIAAAAAAISIAAAGPSAAETYPDRIIKAVVPYTAGGPIDVTARIVAKRLDEVLGHAVVVENRAGASGMIANKAVATAEPDGYTLLFGNTSTLAIFPVLAHTRDFDVLKRLTPVAKLIQRYEQIVPHPDSPPNRPAPFL